MKSFQLFSLSAGILLLAQGCTQVWTGPEEEESSNKTEKYSNLPTIDYKEEMEELERVREAKKIKIPTEDYSNSRLYILRSKYLTEDIYFHENGSFAIGEKSRVKGTWSENNKILKLMYNTGVNSLYSREKSDKFYEGVGATLSTLSLQD